MRSTSMSDSSSRAVRRALANQAICVSTLCLVCAAAHAQSPGITAATVDPAAASRAKAPLAPVPDLLPVPAAPAPVTAPPLPQGEPVISINFKDASVTEVVQLIAEQGNVQIIIAGDINKKLGYINIADVTPEQAIRQVTLAAGLVWQKLEDKTYVVAMPGQLPALPEGANGAPRRFDYGIKPYRPGDPGVVLPVQPDLSQLPRLVRDDGQDDENEPRIYRYIVIKKLSPRWIGWWLDPAHNPKPLEVVQSEENLRALKETTQYGAHSAMDPNVVAAMNGTVPYGAPGFNSPYAPAGSLGNDNNDQSYGGGYGQFAQPYTRGNAQFGFGGNGGNQGGRGGRGGRGGNQGGRGGRGGNQGGAAGGAGGNGGQGLFDLPDGVDSIVAVDPQNALLVYGTAAGVAQLQTIIDFLDKPLRQVEIEAQYVTVSLTDSSSFGIDVASSNGPFNFSVTGQAPQAQAGSLAIGFVRNNFRATLTALISTNRAKVVTAPRVTAINNLTASLTSQVNNFILLNSSTSGIGGQVATAQNIVNIPATTFLVVTPTINDDGTITVRMTPTVSTSTVPTASNPIPQTAFQSLNTVAIVKDGDTIALGGLRSKNIGIGGTRVPILGGLPIIGGLFRTHNKSALESELIIFLTARIVHLKADEDAAVPNT